ncbi:MAG: RNA polymerase sigma factor [Prevotella sp.]|nr:RNA polymerase sigma factor [Prevotella sp.]
MTAEEFNKTVVPLRDKLLQQALCLSAHDADTAEDLVQETLIKLWEMRDHLPRHPNIAALASTILRNKWNDHWRRSQHALNDTVPLNLQDATSYPPDDMEIIDLIVSNLPPLQQQIFRMKEIEGYEKGEIMLVTGCSDESLRQNLSRARRRIREQFTKMRSL